MDGIKYERYLLVGTGPSVKTLSFADFETLSDNVIIVSVNSSILFLPKADIWFTLDDSFRNLKYAGMAHSRQIPVVMALEEAGRRKHKNSPYYFLDRASKPVYIQKRYPNTPLGWFSRWGCLEGLSEDTSCIHSGNSLAGALNLAFFDKPKKIGILGLDGSDQRSAGGGHSPNNLSHLPFLFSTYKKQLDDSNIQVKNGSPNSAVTCFERCTPKELIEWINSE